MSFDVIRCRALVCCVLFLADFYCGERFPKQVSLFILLDDSSIRVGHKFFLAGTTLTLVGGTFATWPYWVAHRNPTMTWRAVLFRPCWAATRPSPPKSSQDEPLTVIALVLYGQGVCVH